MKTAGNYIVFLPNIDYNVICGIVRVRSTNNPQVSSYTKYPRKNRMRGVV